jgi:hypothetical protein
MNRRDHSCTLGGTQWLKVEGQLQVESRATGAILSVSDKLTCAHLA